MPAIPPNSDGGETTFDPPVAAETAGRVITYEDPADAIQSYIDVEVSELKRRLRTMQYEVNGLRDKVHEDQLHIAQLQSGNNDLRTANRDLKSLKSNVHALTAGVGIMGIGGLFYFFGKWLAYVLYPGGSVRKVKREIEIVEE
jgi:hypothetical protein